MIIKIILEPGEVVDNVFDNAVAFAAEIGDCGLHHVDVYRAAHKTEFGLLLRGLSQQAADRYAMGRGY